MQSFLIIARDKNKASDYISDFLNKEKVNSFDISREIYEKAVGIEDVRNIQKKILLKPFKGLTKAVIIQTYESITSEAQNALLKILEEPPINTIIIISVPQKELILPTIISRCKIIVLKEEKSDLSNAELAEFDKILDILLNGKVGGRLKIAQDLSKDKETAIWLEKIAVFVRNKLIENHENPKYLNLLKELQKTYKSVKSTNVNPRIALENLFLSL